VMRPAPLIEIEVIMDIKFSLACALLELTVGGLGVDASVIEGDPVLELMGFFLAVEVCLHCGLEPPCTGNRTAQAT
jgi:hypothetical protein